MERLHFLSFADSKSAPILKRIRKNAEETEWFDNIEVWDEHSFDKWYIKKYHNRFHLRGFGYWMWKSYLVKRKLTKMEDGSFLLYADAGCTLNKAGEQRLKEYLSMVENNEFGLLAFQQENLIEEQWTKADLLQYVNKKEIAGGVKTGQLWGGAFILRKTEESRNFIDEWFDLCHNHFELITDQPSVHPNPASFKEHRHDQSAFSCLAKKHRPVIVNADETYTDDDFSMKLSKYPIWATRLREYTWWGFKKMTLKKKLPLLFGRLW